MQPNKHNQQFNDLSLHVKLAASDLRSRFFDLSLDLFCILDQAGNLQLANRAFLSMIQQEAAEILDSPFVSLVYPEDQASVLACLPDEASQLNSPLSFVCRHLCHDNTLRWYLWTVYPLDDALLHAVGRDITSYKQMEIKELERNIFAEALLDTVLAINSSLALDQVLDRILSNIGKVVTYEYVSILLVELDRAEVVGTQSIAQKQAPAEDIRGKTFAIQDNRYLRYMFDTRESIIVPEIEQAPAWVAEPDKHSLGAFLGAPIVVEGAVIGFLCVFNTHKEFFTPLHAQQLITFANQVGIAINNARLYEQAQSAAILRERQRMAQELHDSVNQDLFAASTYADLLPKAIHKKPQLVAQYAHDISKLIRGAVDQMRMILIELHPDSLTTTGLEVLIQQLCNVFSRQTELSLNLNSSNSKIILEEKVQIAIYRIAQEALHNISKHAQATQINVTLRLSKEELFLMIEDNGLGFNQEAISDLQFGISGMCERAQSINANLQIDSKIGAGTKITLRKSYYERRKKNPYYSSG